MDYSTDFYALLFLATPRDKHPEKFMWPEYYKHIASPQKYTTDVVSQFPEGVRMPGVYAEFTNRESGEKERYNPDDVITFLHNDHLIGEYLQNNEFRRYRSYEQYSVAGKYQMDQVMVADTRPPCLARSTAFDAAIEDGKLNIIGIILFEGLLIYICHSRVSSALSRCGQLCARSLV